MTNIERMTLVDNLTTNISGELGELASLGVISSEDSFAILALISNSQCDWMAKHFGVKESVEFMFQKIREDLQQRKD